MLSQQPKLFLEQDKKLKLKLKPNFKSALSDLDSLNSDLQRFLRPKKSPDLSHGGVSSHTLSNLIKSQIMNNPEIQNFRSTLKRSQSRLS